MSDISNSYRYFNRNLVALSAFIIVAQQGNISAAAAFMGISQSAVSQRIKSLEADLGVVLFKRKQRGVALTSDGLQLYSSIQPTMKQIHQSVHSLMERKSKPQVRLSLDFAFATFWLLPRLPHLRNELEEEIDIQILASQTPVEAAGDSCDLIIHMSKIRDMEKNDVLLMKERTAAVCSPVYLEKNGPIKTPAELLDKQLLSLGGPPSAPWYTWQSWLQALDVTGEQTGNITSFNNYDLVTQAAISGHGIALGWLGLIDGLIKSRDLVKVTEHTVISDRGYVITRTPTTNFDAPDRVFEWITRNMSENH